MAPSPSQDHPDLLALDALRAGEGTLEDKAHVESCGACRETLARLEHTTEGLRAFSRRAPDVPLEVDQAIFARAGKELESLRRRRHFGFRRWVAAAAAACVLATIIIVFTAVPRRPEPTVARIESLGPPPSGTVDIVDAYRLARRLRSGGAVDPAWDWNHDGAVDSKDVDEIAKESVSLLRRPR